MKLTQTNMEKTLERWKASPTNNARHIMRKKLEKMRDNPSERLAQELEHNFGIVVDYQASDAGEPPANYNVEEHR